MGFHRKARTVCSNGSQGHFKYSQVGKVLTDKGWQCCMTKLTKQLHTPLEVRVFLDILCLEAHNNWVQYDDDVMTWMCFPHNWPFVGESDSHWWIPLTKGQWCRTLMLAWKSCWTNVCVAVEFRCHSSDNTLLNVILQWERQIRFETHNKHLITHPHSSPSWGNYGVPLVSR